MCPLTLFPLYHLAYKKFYFRNVSTNYIESIHNAMGHLQINKLLKPIIIIVKVLVIKLKFRGFYLNAQVNAP